MKLKSIIAGIALTVGSLFVAIQPAQAETCSNGTYTVAGINTFGDLPCQDPGTEINVTVRGLHDYGVSGGPTAYCSFIYVRKNLGTAQSPNWSASTNTVCDPKPTPVVVANPTPEPTPTPTPTPVVVEQTIANPGECSIANPCHSYAMLDSAETVINVIVCQPTVCGSGIFDGRKVVPQVAAGPTGQNQGGVFFNPETNKQVTYSGSTNAFTVKEDGNTIKTFIAPEISQNNSATVVTTLSVIFGATKDSGTVSANISGKEIVSNSENPITQQNLFFEKSETEQTVRVAASRLSILSARIERLLNLLSGWLL